MKTYKISEKKVYYKNLLFPEADAETFEELFGWYGKDKNHVFFKYSLLPFLDPKTTILLPFDYIKDNNYFCFGDTFLERDL